MDFILLSVSLPGGLTQLVFDKPTASPASVSSSWTHIVKSYQGTVIPFKDELPTDMKLCTLKKGVSEQDWMGISALTWKMNFYLLLAKISWDKSPRISRCNDLDHASCIEYVCDRLLWGANNPSRWHPDRPVWGLSWMKLCLIESAQAH